MKKKTTPKKSSNGISKVSETPKLAITTVEELTQLNHDQQILQIQKILDYFVAEGMAYEISPGQYTLTEEGKKMVA